MKKDYANYILQKNRENYNLIAKDFSKTREKPWEELRPLFDHYLKKSERVLDLGCGNGRYFDWFKEKEVDYIGADNSEKLIQEAREKNPNAKFIYADALELPFVENSFDKVYSIAVLHHIPSKELRMKFLEQIKKVLKPEGILILTAWKIHQRKEILTFIKYFFLKILGFSKMDYKDTWETWGNYSKRYYHFFSKRELIRLIKNSGFGMCEAGVLKNKKGNRQNFYIVAKAPVA